MDSLAVVSCLVILAILAMVAWPHRFRGRSNFVSKRAKEIYGAAAPLLAETQGNASYSTFKPRVSGSDINAVTYTDIRESYRAGRLTPDAVQSLL